MAVLIKKNRPSPSESATLFDVGTEKIGNDGNVWIIVANKNGVKRWNKLNTKNKEIKHPNTNTYFTHNNGDRPYLIYLGDHDAYIYIIDGSIKYDELETLDDQNRIFAYTNKVKHFRFQKAFIGKGLYRENTIIYDPEFDGNTVLLKINNYKYIYIGEIIYEFSTNNDNITEYYSVVGNNDVPYPVAFSDKFAYFMYDKLYLPVEKLFNDVDDTQNINEIKSDAYRLFYEYKKKYNENFTGFHNVKIIHDDPY